MDEFDVARRKIERLIMQEKRPPKKLWKRLKAAMTEWVYYDEFGVIMGYYCSLVLGWKMERAQEFRWKWRGHYNAAIQDEIYRRPSDATPEEVLARLEAEIQE